MLSRQTLLTLIQTIVQQQKMIIGPIAIMQANKVTGLTISNNGQVDLRIEKDEEGSRVLIALIEKYAELFGKVSIEACKDAIKEIRPPIQNRDLPQILQ